MKVSPLSSMTRIAVAPVSAHALQHHRAEAVAELAVRLRHGGLGGVDLDCFHTWNGCSSEIISQAKLCEGGHTGGRFSAQFLPPNAHLVSGVAMSDSTPELDHRHLWHPFTQQRDWCAEEPLVIERGEGSELIDTEGRRYIDGVSSLWCNVHGHRHPVIDAAVHDQLDRIAHSTMLGLTHPGAARAGRRLVEIAPPGLVAGLLLGLRLDGGRDRAEDGLPVLAAARRRARAGATRSSA